MNNQNTKGLRERIATAETIDEARRLLSEGIEHYSHASFKAVRQWQVTATRRIYEVNNGED